MIEIFYLFLQTILESIWKHEWAISQNNFANFMRHLWILFIMWTYCVLIPSLMEYLDVGSPEDKQLRFYKYNTKTKVTLVLKLVLFQVSYQLKCFVFSNAHSSHIYALTFPLQYSSNLAPSYHISVVSNKHGSYD